MEEPIDSGSAYGELSGYGPGKFALLVDRVAYDASLSGCDDEAGSCPDNGLWAGIVRSGLKIDGPFCDVEVSVLTELSEADKDFLREQGGGFIITENDQGFVDVRWFTKDEAEEREEIWSEILEDLALPEEESGEED